MWKELFVALQTQYTLPYDFKNTLSRGDFVFLPSMQFKIDFTYQSQNPPNFKVVLSDKTGSKHPMLSISMAYK